MALVVVAAVAAPHNEIPMFMTPPPSFGEEDQQQPGQP